MAYGRFFSSMREWPMCRFIIQLFESFGIWPCDLQNSHGDILRSQSEDVNQSSEYFRAPSFSLFLRISWVVQIVWQTATEGSNDGLLHNVQEIGYFQSSSCPVSPAITIFKDILHSPKIERFQACEIFSQ